MPAAHAIGNDAAQSICAIVETYEAMFGLRKLTSAFVYVIFTASCMHVANCASLDPQLANSGRHRLQQCVGWLNRMSATWGSAGHHRDILMSLGDVGERGRQQSRLTQHRGDGGRGHGQAFADLLASRVPSRPPSPQPADTPSPPFTPKLALPPSMPPMPSTHDLTAAGLLDMDDWGDMFVGDPTQVPEPNLVFWNMPLGSEVCVCTAADAHNGVWFTALTLLGPLQDPLSWQQYTENYLAQLLASS